MSYILLCKSSLRAKQICSKMDAPEEESDVKLQLNSHEFIADFDRSLLLYLRKQDGSGGTTLRSRVRVRETTRLIGLLDPFQELPQLLDQHLPKWLPLLAESFLEYLLSRKRTRAARSTRSDLLMPLSTGMCKILYTFCKIRGEKVIVRFLNNETKYLELLSSALEECERNAAGQESLQWSWEERYIVLLWLSHLFLAPFDLATISSADVDEEDLPSILGLRWPAKLPGITVRVLPLAIKYLSSPGKERDAAKALLVRIAMRKDMQALGVLEALVKWSLLALRPCKDDESKTPYYYIGVLSFLAGILSASSDTSDMAKYLTTIFNAVYSTSSSGSSPITASALARKTMIKVIRSITILVLRQQSQSQSHSRMADTELVETTIGYLLESLADNDTPVRLAASKALSIITLKLDVDMASQVVEAVIESLGRNVLWSRPAPASPRVRDLSAVNPLEWHGLMMTLSHLLYRRSPPAENLSDIINALLMGLSFEQRSSSGGSIGTNVRDAACFGIWALARRYTTKELLAVPTAKTVSAAAKHYTSPPSILQILASELIVTGSLDPAGNIRRGSSAALQELIGRHPDCVVEGIRVVQTVDYHAVALRARAIGQVALEATRVYGLYGEAVLDALLTWRGIGDPDVTARRAAAKSFGDVNAELAKEGKPWERLRGAVAEVMRRIRGLAARQVEERHGLILALAAVLDSLPSLAGGRGQKDEMAHGFVQDALAAVEEIMVDCRDKKYRRPELVAEAAGQLVVSSLPLLQAAVLGLQREKVWFLSGSALVASQGQTIVDLVSTIDSADGRGRLQKLLAIIHGNLREWLKRPEEDNIAVAARAGLVLLCFCDPTLREDVIRGWALSVREIPKGNRAGTGASGAYFAALSMAYPITSTFQSQEQAAEDRTLICRTIQERWAGDKDIDIRVAILKSLTGTEVLRQNAVELLGVIEEGLDDYTTNARGDVGSLVRLQAIRATKSVWQALKKQAERDVDEKQGLSGEVSRLFPRILRLAAEKLDRVRVEAQATLSLALSERYLTFLPSSPSRPVRMLTYISSAVHLQKLTFSSTTYFRFLLDLLASSPASSQPTLHPIFASQISTPAQRLACLSSLLSGYVTSADTGNEDLVISSRAALTSFCSSAPDGSAVSAALVGNLRSFSGLDRVAVPTLEVIAFLFHVGLFAAHGRETEGMKGYDHKALCLLVQKAGYKSGNVRKIEACVRVYGAIAALQQAGTDGLKTAGGAKEARKRLGALLLHPWPRVRGVVVDELWGLLVASEEAEKAEKLLGVDWGKADKGPVKGLAEELGLV